MQTQYLWKYERRITLRSLSCLPRDQLMRPTEANVIDFTLYRKRRQARAAAELMWNLYVARAGLAAFIARAAVSSSDTRQA
ncbi:hypothetical protein EC915_101878 [Pseudomonas sp. LP_7_YM]|nr:hypothetical protein EC915_101878 [Pseudomonas sp. LP_7_YM]